MWKFEVHNVGKVDYAKIEMAPLVLLVGRNNTGKSYVATVAWAISNMFAFLSREECKSRRPDWYNKFAKKGTSEKGATFRIDKEVADEIMQYVNNELKTLGPDFLQDVFAYPGFESSSVNVLPDEPFIPFSIALSKTDPSESEKRAPFIVYRIIESTGQPAFTVRIAMRTKETASRVEDRLFVEMIYRILFGQNGRRLRAAVYVPAARTGLMIAMKALIAKLFDEDPPTPNLPRPLADFLQRLSLRTGAPNRPQSEVADWLQAEVMHGRIEASDDDIPSITYFPDNSTTAVPLHAASSMITELAPFLLLLRDAPISGQIIFEEPEAHLHLSAQRSMARAIARLLNKGTRFIVTTHSDTFVQQINNLMSLFSHPNREQLMRELGYTSEDLIDPACAIAYEFTDKERRTVVSEVNRTSDGFVVPTLNDTLYELAKETISLQGTE